tara:strand:+ start:6388 stop:7035 length:648 start_codon:yes stop_codon:yes gene_type:complete
MSELNKRIFTSLGLFLLLFLSIKSNLVLFISLILITFEIFFEFYVISKKIYRNKSNIIFFLILFCFNLYLMMFLFSALIPFILSNNMYFIYFLFILTVCISSDIGGYTFGKILKGKKITKISPNKTYAGMIGSFFLSIFLSCIIFNDFMTVKEIILVSFLISLISQIGDLFVSFLKRKAKVKDTGNILPGHGGLLDRFDGLLFALPLGTLLFQII